MPYTRHIPWGLHTPNSTDKKFTLVQRLWFTNHEGYYPNFLWKTGRKAGYIQDTYMYTDQESEGNWKH